ncbi:hypothetical protein Nepgr_027500 [Nepenthes gracilis]|uniref:Kinetochore protein Spc24 n=1 Tax=Nepenthes gracilis TaxID=150966 RepID=A0AAD3TA71_NEPGR|nr:hypothetical protein Nepgr_027500 [Nepenthes gracilis]
MGDAPRNFDLENLWSYCDDLVGVLRDKRDIRVLSQCLEYSNAIQSSSNSDFNDVQSSIRDFQKKIDDCKQKIEEAKSNVVADEELGQLQKQLDEELQTEHLLLEDTKLSFYASVTNIIPDLDSKCNFSGQIVRRDKQVAQRFDFDPAKEDSYDICNSIWKMINH